MSFSDIKKNLPINEFKLRKGSISLDEYRSLKETQSIDVSQVEEPEKKSFFSKVGDFIGSRVEEREERRAETVSIFKDSRVIKGGRAALTGVANKAFEMIPSAAADLTQQSVANLSERERLEAFRDLSINNGIPEKDIDDQLISLQSLEKNYMTKAYIQKLIDLEGDEKLKKTKLDKAGNIVGETLESTITEPINFIANNDFDKMMSGMDKKRSDSPFTGGFKWWGDMLSGRYAKDKDKRIDVFETETTKKIKEAQEKYNITDTDMLKKQKEDYKSQLAYMGNVKEGIQGIEEATYDRLDLANDNVSNYVYNAAGGATSLGLSLALFAATKNPNIAALTSASFFALTDNEDFDLAVERGMEANPDLSKEEVEMAVSQAGALKRFTTFITEKIGFGLLFNRLSGGNALNFVKGTAEQLFEEVVQNSASNYIENTKFNKNKKFFDDTIDTILYTLPVALFGGASTSYGGLNIQEREEIEYQRKQAEKLLMERHGFSDVDAQIAISEISNLYSNAVDDFMDNVKVDPSVKKGPAQEYEGGETTSEAVTERTTESLIEESDQLYLPQAEDQLSLPAGPTVQQLADNQGTVRQSQNDPYLTQQIDFIINNKTYSELLKKAKDSASFEDFLDSPSTIYKTGNNSIVFDNLKNPKTITFNGRTKQQGQAVLSDRVVAIGEFTGREFDEFSNNSGLSNVQLYEKILPLLDTDGIIINKIDPVPAGFDYVNLAGNQMLLMNKADTNVNPVDFLKASWNKKYYREQKKSTTEKQTETTEEDVEAKRTGQQNTEFFTGKAAEASSKVPYEAVIETPQVPDNVKEAFDMYTMGGNFTGHISKMIPAFAEKQMAVTNAIIESDAKSFLDIGASEGGVAKTVSAINPEIKSIALDPNVQMQENFNKTPEVKGAEFKLEALGASWVEDDGTVINEFKPTEKFDVINEDFAFQFINNDRTGQVEMVKEMMSEDGVFISSEKFIETENYDQNETKKYDHQSKYFSPDQLTEDKQTIVSGMAEDMVNDVAYEKVLSENFEFVAEYWNSGNFKGYLASNNKAKFDKFLKDIGDVNSEFSEVKTPRILGEENVVSYKALIDVFNKEGGATINLDGTIKKPDNDKIVSLRSKNVKNGTVTEEMIRDFVKENQDVIDAFGDDIKIGLFPLTKGDKTSIDINLITKDAGIATDLATQGRQESVWDEEINSTIETGFDGNTPKKLSIKQVQEALNKKKAPKAKKTTEKDPVKSKGDKKTSRLLERAIEEGIVDQDVSQEDFNRANMAENRKKAAEFVINETDNAIAISLGYSENNTDILSNSISLATAEYMRLKGRNDVATQIYRATTRKATRAGQEIASLAGLGNTSVYGFYKDLMQSKLAGFNDVDVNTVLDKFTKNFKRNSTKKRKENARNKLNEAKKEAKKDIAANVKIEAGSFLDSLLC